MPWTSHDCPVCGEEIRIEVLPDSDDTGRQLCVIGEWESQCDCSLTYEQIDVLQDAACENVSWETTWEVDYD